jgi:hypothetical protein
MTEQEIYKKIEDIYNSDKGKGFITHLLRSFFPVGKGNYAFFNEEDKKYVCCITGVKLGTKEDIFATLQSKEGQKVYMDDFFGMTKAMVNGDKEYTHSEEFLALREKVNPLAVVAEKSTKCLSVEAYQQLQNFYVNELFRDNKHIIWISNNERAKETIKFAKRDGLVKTKREERAVHRKLEHSTTKLGDLKALQEIRNRIEKNEKK